MARFGFFLLKRIAIFLGTVVFLFVVTTILIRVWLYQVSQHIPEPGDAPTVPVRNAPLVKMDPMFVPYPARGDSAFWIDDNRFMVSALPFGTKPHGEPSIYIGDVRTGHYKLLVEDATFTRPTKDGFLAIRVGTAAQAPSTQHVPAQEVKVDSQYNVVSIGPLTGNWQSSFKNQRYPDSYSSTTTAIGDLVRAAKDNWFLVFNDNSYKKLNLLDSENGGIFFDKNVNKILINSTDSSLNNSLTNQDLKIQKEYKTIDEHGNVARNLFPVEIQFYKILNPSVFLNKKGTIFIKDSGFIEYKFNNGAFIKENNGEFFKFWGGRLWAGSMQASPNDCLLFLPYEARELMINDVNGFEIVNLCALK